MPTGLFGTPLEYEEGLAAFIGADTVEEMYRRLGVDVWHCRGGLVPNVDVGNIWGPAEGEAPPFADVNSVQEVENYPFPDPGEWDASELEEEIDAHREFSVCGGINSAVFHKYLSLCGQENALVYLRSAPEIAKAIIEKITDFWVVYLEKVLEAGQGRIDMIENCNDFGTQRSMFISPGDFREFFRPALQRLYDKAKEYGVMYMQHSCGAIRPIIHDFFEMGADILNPIQVRAEGMNVEELAHEYRGKIAFYGGVDTQELLVSGPEKSIRDEVRRLFEIFGLQGGFILSGSQGLLEDIPYEHAVAMLEENLRCFVK